MKYSRLERLYESMLVPIGPFSIETGPAPESNIIDRGEELTEEQEVSIAKKIIKLTDSLDDIASEAHVKAYRRRIEDISEEIRDYAKDLIKGHPEV